MDLDLVSTAEMNDLIALAAGIRWPWPTSGGTPIREGHPDYDKAKMLVADRDKLVSAVTRLLSEGELKKAVKLAADSWRVWLVARDPAGGRAFLAPVLGNHTQLNSADHAYVLYGDGLLALWQGNAAESRASNDEALEIALDTGDQRALVLAHLGIARVEVDHGDAERAMIHVLESRLHVQDLGPEWDQAPLFIHAQVCRKMKDFESAASLFAQSVELNRQIDDRGMIMAELENLGRMEARLGSADDAGRHFAESVEVGFAIDKYRRVMMDLNDAMVEAAHRDQAKLRPLVEKIEAAMSDLDMELGWDDGGDWEWVRNSLR